jgi:hypothetical protein
MKLIQELKEMFLLLIMQHTCAPPPHILHTMHVVYHEEDILETVE